VTPMWCAHNQSAALRYPCRKAAYRFFAAHEIG
jgi:hypothetical protein